MAVLETDYLVVGAGASGMAFVDALVEASDADVTMVDRRHRPGGHWNDAYRFVRLHQPSACYGVNSLPLGDDRIDHAGPNAGFYERATAPELCHYYERVLDEQLVASGQVRFLSMHDYQGADRAGHRVVSRVTGEETTVRVRRRLVDATYLEAPVPATHTPQFEVDPQVQILTPTGLVDLDGSAQRFTVLGAGKTAMDTCSWLLEQGVEPDRISWVRPREAWVLDRGFVQPLELLPNLLAGVANEAEAAARAEDVDDLFPLLEESGQLHRLDAQIEPGMYRGAILSQAERASLRQISRVVRLGRVRRLTTRRMLLDHGEVPTDGRTLYVDCTAKGLGRRLARPIFEPGRITLQQIQFGIVPFSAALTGFVEATRDQDADKNRLCPPNRAPDAAVDWVSTTLTLWRAQAEWANEPDVQHWLDNARLNIDRGVCDHLDKPQVTAALDRISEHQERAMSNLERLHVEVGAAVAG